MVFVLLDDAGDDPSVLCLKGDRRISVAGAGASSLLRLNNPITAPAFFEALGEEGVTENNKNIDLVNL